MTEYTELTLGRDPSTVKTDNISDTNHQLHAFFADLTEVMPVIPPYFSASYAALAHNFQAIVADLETDTAGPFSAYPAFPSDFISLSY